MTPNTVYFVEVQFAPDFWKPVLKVAESYAFDTEEWTSFGKRASAQLFATKVSSLLPGHTVRVARRVARGVKKGV